MNVFELDLADGRRLRCYDRVPIGREPVLTIVWHHGTPNIGRPPRPLFDASDRLGIRWVSLDRPGYGGSTPNPGRDVASVAADVAAIVDALQVPWFVAMGHSGGGPHALGCAALLGSRVRAVVSVSGLAPFGAAGLDWFAGMSAASEASLRAAAAGRSAKEAYEASAATEDPVDPGFVPADLDALTGPWRWFEEVVGPALADGPGPMIDDDLAYVHPWGFDPHDISVPTLIVHGRLDRMVPVAHGEWLAAACPHAELLASDDGHLSVLRHAEHALTWLVATAAAAP